MAHKCLRGRKGVQKTRIKQNSKKKSKAGNKAEKKGEAKPSQIASDGPVKKAAKKEARLQAGIEKQHRGLYTTSERILLVGEGNLSFALALCKNLESGSGVYATAYDGEALAKRKYPDLEEIMEEIDQKFSGTTLFGVDATRLHKVREFRGSFNKIVWNFPHIGGGKKDVEQSIADHRQLLATFFASAQKCLVEEGAGAIHVALKAGEPYQSWKVVQLARNCGLDLQSVVQFSLDAWPGYAHRRTKGFDDRFSAKDSEELAKGAKVYVFRRTAASAQ